MLLLPQIPTASLKVPRLLCTSDQLEKNSGFLLPLMFDNLKKKKTQNSGIYYTYNYSFNYKG